MPNEPTYVIPSYDYSLSLICWSVVAGPIVGVFSVGFVRIIAGAGPRQAERRGAAARSGWRARCIGALSIPFPQVLATARTSRHSPSREPPSPCSSRSCATAPLQRCCARERCAGRTVHAVPRHGSAAWGRAGKRLVLAVAGCPTRSLRRHRGGRRPGRYHARTDFLDRPGHGAHRSRPLVHSADAARGGHRHGGGAYARCSVDLRCPVQRSTNESLAEGPRALAAVEDTTSRALIIEDGRMAVHEAARCTQAGAATRRRRQRQRSAAEALRSSRFDIVLLDLGLPGRDGFEVLRELRSARRCRRRASSSRPATTCTIEFRGSTPARTIHRQAVSTSMKSRRASARCCGGQPDGANLMSIVGSHSIRSRTRSSAMASLRAVGPRVRGSRGFVVMSGHSSVARAIEDRLYGSSEALRAMPSRSTCGLRRKLGNDAIRTLRGVGYFHAKDMIYSRSTVDGIARGGDRVRCSRGCSPTGAFLRKPRTLFDYQLRQMALSLRSQIDGAASGAATDQADSDFVVQIWDLFGTRVSCLRALDLPTSSMRPRSLCGRAGGKSWRTSPADAGRGDPDCATARVRATFARTRLFTW